MHITNISAPRFGAALIIRGIKTTGTTPREQKKSAGRVVWGHIQHQPVLAQFIGEQLLPSPNKRGSIQLPADYPNNPLDAKSLNSGLRRKKVFIPATDTAGATYALLSGNEVWRYAEAIRQKRSPAAALQYAVQSRLSENIGQILVLKLINEKRTGVSASLYAKPYAEALIAQPKHPHH